MKLLRGNLSLITNQNNKMNIQKIKFRIQTIIANSNIDEYQKKVLESYLDTLTDWNLVELIDIFEKEPRAVSVYADYIIELKEQTQPCLPEKLEKILTPLLNKLS